MNFDSYRDKLGPLPVWGWGILVGALILVGVWWRNRNGSPSLDESDVEAAVAAQQRAGWVSGVDTSGIPASALSGGQTPEPQTLTNASWLAQGVKRATDAGYTPLDAERALSKYLEGQTLTQREATIVNLIVQAQGTAPQGTMGIPDVEAPAPTPEPTTNTPATNPAKVATAVHIKHGTRSVWGEPIIVDVTVSAASGTPTGSVTLYHEGKLVGTRTLSGGKTTFSIATPTTSQSFDKDGLVNFSATYKPTGSFAPSSGSSPYPINMKASWRA